jgi:Leucine-rich repeat (LRR) protein
MNTPGYQEALRRIADILFGNLNLSNLNLTISPPIPDDVGVFNCNNNLLTELPDLPTSLMVLKCDNNQLISLPELPASLTELYCNNNKITSLPKLSASLKFAYCNNNRLTTIPEIPLSLVEIQLNDNPLIEPFRGFYTKYQETFNIKQLRNSVNSYRASIQAKGRNMSGLKQTLGRVDSLPGNILSSIGSFLSGKPGNANMQMTALKRNVGQEGGRRKTRRHRKSRKARKEKSRRRN